VKSRTARPPQFQGELKKQSPASLARQAQSYQRLRLTKSFEPLSRSPRVMLWTSVDELKTFHG